LIQNVLDLDGDNKAARNKVAICLQEIKAQKNRDKKIFANMFDKVPRLIDTGELWRRKRRDGDGGVTYLGFLGRRDS
jgi:hypothetical protein